MNITESELFKNLLETKDEHFHIDLHNAFTCVEIFFLNDTLDLKFRNDKAEGYVTIQFSDVVILKFNIPLRELTIDNFYRGRYELDGKLYDEYQNRKCFYIEFYEGGAIELLCCKAVIKVPNSALN